MTNTLRRKLQKRDSYYRNRAKTLERQRATPNKTRKHNRLLIDSIKAVGFCIDCGEADPACLDFDHRDPTQKEYTISRAIGHLDERRLLAEIAKCDIRCANCHRKRTSRLRHNGRRPFKTEKSMSLFGQTSDNLPERDKEAA